MAQGSAGVKAREIDLSGPTTRTPTGVPAGVIGTSLQGPAFVPVTVGILSDFYAKFGRTDGKKFGPLAVAEWLRNAGSATFLRILGVGEGKKRTTDGSVDRAGFVVGDRLPSKENGGEYSNNTFANLGGELGRTYFLGSFMSESLGSTVLSAAGLQTGNEAVPIVRGVLMAASGVLMKVSSSYIGDNTAPASNLVATSTAAGLMGQTIGCVNLDDSKQEFVLLLNGHKGNDSRYLNTITASFDSTAPNYFANVLNTDPLKLQEAGHYLYSHWDVSPVLAAVTGSSIYDEAVGNVAGMEPAVFLTTGSSVRDDGGANSPNYESWEDRYSHAKSPWIVSQKFAGKPVDLFRLHALDAGANIANLYKISIENIAPSNNSNYPYGTFDLVIRNWEDRDTEQLPLEQWRGLSLDPSNDKYIAKVIGDANVFFDFEREERHQKLVFDGNYPNNSNLVRIEMNPVLENGFVDASALPMGFRGIDHLVTSGTGPLSSDDCSGLMLESDLLNASVTPPLPMRLTVKENVAPRAQVNSRLYWGVQFENLKSLSLPNASSEKNASIKSFTKFFPSFALGSAKFMTGSNPGQPETVELGVVDCDKFCNNLFTLENVMVKQNAELGLADPTAWVDAEYSRNGVVPAGKSAFKVEDLALNDNKKYAKFTLIMQGGFDGVNLFDRDSVEMNNAAVVADIAKASRGEENGATAKAYIKALDIMKNVVNVDIQLLAIPGIREEVITNMASEAVRDRFDALYLMDITEMDNLNSEVTSSVQFPSVSYTAQKFKERNIDNSFAAAYYPDVIVRDPNTGTNVSVPPSVAVLGALALNDRVAHPWFAPAGMVRGALDSVIDVSVKLNQTNLDTLYNVNINPLVAPRAGDKVTVWGQKTLQAGSSALNRVNVRRLLIEIRRQVRDIAQTILFEPNRAATLARFTAAITPRLSRIQSLSGLERFKIIIDSSTTTQQDVENNTIRGKIFVQPTKTIEFVSLDFVVSNSASNE
jgi:phage tail sheath protein FI